jgi:signal transduction histidine kinase
MLMAGVGPHLPRIVPLPSWQDVVVAAVVAAIGQVVVWTQWGSEPFYGSRPYNAALSLVMLGAVAWWRRAPVGVVVWYVALFCGAQAIAPHDLPAWTGFFPLALLVAAAGRTAPFRRALLALVVALAGFGLLGVLEPTLRRSDTMVFDAMVLLLPWLAARLLSVRSARADALEADLAALTAAQEEREREVIARERARMARELHDVVSHSVSLMVVQVGAARMALGDAGRPSLGAAREQLLGAEHTGRSALDQLRRLLGVLRDPDADLHPGLGDDGAAASTEPLPRLGDLPRLVDDFRRKGLDVELAGDPALDEVEPMLELTAYRVVQEGLTNALKHTAGAAVTVRVSVDMDDLRVEVTHDGGRPITGPGTGFGLLGLQERVAVHGGQLHAGPTHTGWRLAARLPRRLSGQAADRLLGSAVGGDEVAR